MINLLLERLEKKLGNWEDHFHIEHVFDEEHMTVTWVTTYRTISGKEKEKVVVWDLGPIAAAFVRMANRKK